MVHYLMMVMVLIQQHQKIYTDRWQMPDGQMFYSITYGKNAMGSYASQLRTKQRWMVIHYIKAKQAAKSASTQPAAMTVPEQRQKQIAQQKKY